MAGSHFHELNKKKKKKRKGGKFILQEENHFKYLVVLPVALGYQQHQSLSLAGEGLLLGNATAVAKFSRIVLGRVCARKRGCDSQPKIPSWTADESCWCLLDLDGMLSLAGCCRASPLHCPQDEFAAEHPLLQVKARGCTEPKPRGERGSCFFFFF